MNHEVNLGNQRRWMFVGVCLCVGVDVGAMLSSPRARTGQRRAEQSRAVTSRVEHSTTFALYVHHDQHDQHRPLGLPILVGVSKN